MSNLPFTGERFVPGARGEIWVEHWHRYHFAARWAAGKRVLDVACGAGYGTALLAARAAKATGVDLSAEAVDHARAAYAQLAKVEFVCASCTQLPLPDASVDLVVSFETVEHIHEQEAFVAEAARVLAPGGLLLLSCPNKLEYSDKRGFTNAFHVKELYREELAKLVGAHFGHVAWYGQRPSFFSVIAAEAGAQAGELLEVAEEAPQDADSAFANPLYFLLLAGRDAQAVASVPPAVSVLSDRGDWVHRDYEKVMHHLEVAVERGEALEMQVGQRERSVQALGHEVTALRDRLTAAQADLQAQTAALMESDSRLARVATELAAKDEEILRRRGVRWWLSLPFIRLRELLS